MTDHKDMTETKDMTEHSTEHSARKNSVNAEDMSDLFHTALAEARERGRGGTWSAELETIDGGIVEVEVSFMVLHYEGERGIRLETVEYNPIPDAMITMGGDYFEDEELEDLLLQADEQFEDVIDGIPVDSLPSPEVQYTESGREKWADGIPYWISDPAMRRLKSVLRAKIRKRKRGEGQ